MAQTADNTIVKETAPCPRCGKPLTNAAELGWCQACGYCRSLDDTVIRNLPVAQEPAQTTEAPQAVAQVSAAVSQLPWWIYLLSAGVLAIGLFSIWRGRHLPATGLPRALWTTIQLAVGIFMLLAAQFIALLRVAPEDPQLTFKDLFLPFRLWGQTLSRARRLWQPILLASWGIALALSAVIFIGGMGHLMTYLPGGQNGPPKKTGS